MIARISTRHFTGSKINDKKCYKNIQDTFFTSNNFFLS